MKNLKVGVCVPARDEVHTSFAFDFAKMTAHDASVRCRDGKGGLQLYTMSGTLIFDQRERLAETALKEGCDVVLFIDSDMRFPADTIDILLNRNVGICGVNAVTRRKPCMPTAKQLIKDDKGHRWINVDSRNKTGVEIVTSLGFGVTMIKKEVFKKVPKKWFEAGWGATGVIGEDVYFCVKAGDHGFDSFVDHDLSKHIGHIGVYEYTWNDIDKIINE